MLICRLFLFSARWMLDVENEKSAASWALIFDWESEMATKLSFELVLDPSVRPFVGSRAWGSSKMYLLKLVLLNEDISIQFCSVEEAACEGGGDNA